MPSYFATRSFSGPTEHYVGGKTYDVDPATSPLAAELIAKGFLVPVVASPSAGVSSAPKPPKPPKP